MIRFEVEYQINSAEWERSAQRRREAWAIPVVHAFLGDLNLGVADSRVFTSGLHTSIADFACQSAIRLGNGCRCPGKAGFSRSWTGPTYQLHARGQADTGDLGCLWKRLAGCP